MNDDNDNGNDIINVKYFHFSSNKKPESILVDFFPVNNRYLLDKHG